MNIVIAYHKFWFKHGSCVQLVFSRFFSSNRSGALSHEGQNLRLGPCIWYALTDYSIHRCVLRIVEPGLTHLRLHQIDKDLPTFDSMSDVMAETTEVLG